MSTVEAKQETGGITMTPPSSAHLSDTAQPVTDPALSTVANGAPVSESKHAAYGDIVVIDGVKTEEGTATPTSSPIKDVWGGDLGDIWDDDAGPHGDMDAFGLNANDGDDDDDMLGIDNVDEHDSMSLLESLGGMESEGPNEGLPITTQQGAVVSESMHVVTPLSAPVSSSTGRRGAGDGGLWDEAAPAGSIVPAPPQKKQNEGTIIEQLIAAANSDGNSTVYHNTTADVGDERALEILEPIEKYLKAEVFPMKYQIAWLDFFLRHRDSGGINGDDMGLGKTFSVWLAVLLDNGPRLNTSKTLLVANNQAVLQQWLRELDKFFQDIPSWYAMVWAGDERWSEASAHAFEDAQVCSLSVRACVFACVCMWFYYAPCVCGGVCVCMCSMSNGIV